MSYDVEIQDVDLDTLSAIDDDSHRHSLSTVHAAQPSTAFDPSIISYGGGSYRSVEALGEQRMQAADLDGFDDASYSTIYRGAESPRVDSQSMRAEVSQLGSRLTRDARRLPFHTPNHASAFDASALRLHDEPWHPFLPDVVRQEGLTTSDEQDSYFSPWLSDEPSNFYISNDKGGDDPGHPLIFRSDDFAPVPQNIADLAEEQSLSGPSSWPDRATGLVGYAPWNSLHTNYEHLPFNPPTEYRTSVSSLRPYRIRDDGLSPMVTAEVPRVSKTSEDFNRTRWQPSQECLECPRGCGKIFTGTHRRGNMQRHLRLLHPHRVKDTEYCCEVKDCGRTFKRQDARLKHHRKCHPELRIYPAIHRKDHAEDTGALRRRDRSAPSLPTGNRTKVSRAGSNVLPDHSATWSDSDEGGVDVTLKNQGARDTKNDDTTGMKDTHLICDTCGQSFRRLADLRRHAQKHEEPKFKCDVTGCERTFYRIDKLRDHVRQTHKGTISTTDSGSLQIEVGEQAKKTIEETSLHRCQKCDSTFRTEGLLKSHVNRKHNLRYQCHDCGAAFGLRADLERHKASVHGPTVETSWRSWRCTNPVCPTPDKVFVRKDNFTRHVQRCKRSLGKRAADDVVVTDEAE